MERKPTYEMLERRVKQLENGASARIKAEDDLRKSEKKYREVFENVSDLWFQIDLDGSVQEINLPFKREWGYRNEEMANLNIKGLMPAKNQSEFDDYVKEVLHNGEGEKILCWLTKDGQGRYLECRTSLIRDDLGRPTGIRGAGSGPFGSDH